VREGLVGLRHAVDVSLRLNGATLLVERVHQLVGEALGHRLLAALTGELDEPADGERAGAARRHLDGDLVGRAADAAGADLERGVSALSDASSCSIGSLPDFSPMMARAFVELASAVLFLPSSDTLLTTWVTRRER